METLDYKNGHISPSSLSCDGIIGFKLSKINVNILMPILLTIMVVMVSNLLVCCFPGQQKLLTNKSHLVVGPMFKHTICTM